MASVTTKSACAFCFSFRRCQTPLLCCKRWWRNIHLNISAPWQILWMSSKQRYGNLRCATIENIRFQMNSLKSWSTKYCWFNSKLWITLTDCLHLQIGYLALQTKHLLRNWASLSAEDFSFFVLFASYCDLGILDNNRLWWLVSYIWNKPCRS